MSLREQGKQQRRQQILQATAELLDESGPDGLSVSGIAERAGVSVATLYNLIGSLDTILSQLVQSLQDNFDHHSTLAEAEPPGPEYFWQFIDISFEALSSNPGILQSSLRSVFQLSIQRSHSQSALINAEQNRQRLIAAIEASVAQGLLKPTVNAELLSEQMMMANAILLENWAAGLIELPRYPLLAKYHLAMLLRAWATRKWSQKLDQQLLQWQQAALAAGESPAVQH